MSLGRRDVLRSGDNLEVQPLVLSAGSFQDTDFERGASGTGVISSSDQITPVTRGNDHVGSSTGLDDTSCNAEATSGIIRASTRTASGLEAHHDDTGITIMSTRAPRMSWRRLNDLSDCLANATLNFAFHWHGQTEDQSRPVLAIAFALRTSSLRYCTIASNTRLMVLSSRSGPRYLDD